MSSPASIRIDTTAEGLLHKAFLDLRIDIDLTTLTDEQVHERGVAFRDLVCEHQEDKEAMYARQLAELFLVKHRLALWSYRQQQ